MATAKIIRSKATQNSNLIHFSSKAKKASNLLSGRLVENLDRNPIPLSARSVDAHADLSPEAKRDIKPWADRDVKKLISKYGVKPVERALHASQNIWAMQHFLGLSKKELFDMALFIETKLPESVKEGRIYVKKERSGLARTIEYDPITKRTFIHLKTHGGVHKLGEGTHKKVTRSIMYDVDAPEMVANLTFKDEASDEVAVIKMLKNEPGMPTTFAITEHKKWHTNKKVVNVIQKHYNGGNFFSYLYSPGKYTRIEVMRLARDLINCLENIHKYDLVHRDLHGGNLLVERKFDPKLGKDRLSAVITDFGQARSVKEAVKLAPKIEVPHRLNPPDAFWRTTENIDPKAVEVYALGQLFYQLYFGTFPEWVDKDEFKHLKTSDYGKVVFRKKLERRMESIFEERLATLTDTVADQFARLILRMCDPNPNRRGTAREIREKMDDLVRRAEAL